MFHGIFFRKNSSLETIQKNIINGTNDILNIDPDHRAIETVYNYESGFWIAQAINKDSDDTITSYNDLIIVGWIKLYNRDEIFSKLNLEIDSKMSDEELLLRLYEKFNDKTPEYLYGDYSFAIFNTMSKEFFCVRDHMGVRPFYYYLDDDIFILSSSQVIFNYLDIINISASKEWICRLLAGGTNTDFEKTAYNEVFKIPPAHYLKISSNDIFKKKYFEFSTKKVKLDSNEQYFKEYEEKLKTAVVARFKDSKYPIGSEITGGLDSSTVTSYIAEYFDQPIKELYTYGFTFLEQEPKYALLVNQMYMIPNAFLCCGNPVPPNKKNPLDILGAPVEHTNATVHEIFYNKAAKDGVRSLFSGFGGDEFVTSIHGDLVKFELLAEKRFKDLLLHFRGNIITKPLRLLKFLMQNNVKRGKKGYDMLNAFKSRWPFFIVKNELLEQFKLKERYFNVGNQDNGYISLDKYTLDKRWVAFVPTRTDNCSLMAASYGIDYFWPLLDVRLIQFFLSTPNNLKFHNGISRYFHRKAVENIVPTDITWKNTKCMGESIAKKNKNLQSEKTINKNIQLKADISSQLKDLLDLEKVQNLNSCNDIFTLNTTLNDIERVDAWLRHFNLKIK